MQLETKLVIESVKTHRFAELVLDVGIYLISSGSHCGRVKMNIESLANTWGFKVDMSQSFKGLFVSVSEKKDTKNIVTLYRSTPSPSVNFSGVSEVADLVYEVNKNHLSIDFFENKFAEIKKIKHYNMFFVALASSVSCAGLTLIANGDHVNALVSFIGVFLGAVSRSYIVKFGFNHVGAVGIGAFITTLITCLAYLLNYGAYPEVAVAISVLYLIPGVPLLNSVIDLIDGYLSAAIQRAVFSSFIILAIAAGMTLCITLFGINNIS